MSKFTGPPKNPKTGITKFSNMPVLPDSVTYDRNDPRLMSDPDLVYGRSAFRKDPLLQRVTLGNTPDGFTNQLITGYSAPGVVGPNPNVTSGLNPYGQVATYTNGQQNVATEPWRKRKGGKLTIEQAANKF